MKRDVTLGLNGATELGGHFELGAAADQVGLTGFAEITARPSHSWAFFGRGEAFMPWDDLSATEGRVLFGARGTW